MYWFLLLSLFKFLPLGWKRVLSRNSGQNSGFRLPSTEGAGSIHALELTRPKDPTNGVPRDKKWVLKVLPPFLELESLLFFFFLKFFSLIFPGLVWTRSLSFSSLMYVLLPWFWFVWGFFLVCMWIWETFSPCGNKGAVQLPSPWCRAGQWCLISLLKE